MARSVTRILLLALNGLALSLLSLMIWADFAPLPSAPARAALVLPRSAVPPPPAPQPAADAPAAPDQPRTTPTRPKNFDGTLGGCNPSLPPNCANAGNYPVSLPVGNFWHAFSDLSLPGRGPALHFGRTYNSLPASTGRSDGPLGSPAWTHSYNMSIRWTCDWWQCWDDRWIVTQENASTAEFLDLGGSTYSPRYGEHATLISDTTGALIMTRNQTHDQFIFHPCHRGTVDGCTNSTNPLAGKLAKVVDRNNYTTTLAYTSTGTLAGFLSTVTDPAGRSLQMTYSQYGGVWVLTRVQDSTGRAVDFGYDANHDLRTAADVAGNVTSYTYDAYSQMLTMTDPRQGTVTNSYIGGEGLVSQQTDPLSRTLLFGYSQPGCGGLSSYTVAAMTDTLGYTTVYTTFCAQHGTDHRIDQATHNPGRPDQATWEYDYDDSQNHWSRTRVRDPYGRVYTSTYDTNGNLTSLTDPLSRKMSYRYDTANNLLVLTNTRGVTTTFGYDANNNLTSITQPLTATSQLLTTTLGYDPTKPGDVLTITNPLGLQWRYTHDATYGYVLTTTDPLTNITGLRYDTVGRVTTLYTPRSYTATFAYNAYGDATRITDTLGFTTVYTYDANRNLTTVTNTKGITTTYTYDAADELTRVLRADGTHSDYGYDGNGNVLTVTNGLTQTTLYGYDSFNRVMTVTTPLTVTGVYSYDLVGNLTVLTNAQGLTTTFGYNAANELTSITYHDGGVTPNVSFSYAAPGLRASMGDGTGTSSYTYDSLDRLTAVEDGLGADVGYAYDLASRLTGLTYPDDGSGTVRTVTRAYNEATRQIELNDWLNNTYTFQYDADGNRTGLSYPNGVTGSWSYDAADQLTSLSYAPNGPGLPWLSVSYSRDALGLLATASENGGSMANAYEYDRLNRLVGDGLSGSQTITRTWSYDGAYEITATRYQLSSNTPITTTRSYNAGNQLLYLREGPQGGSLTRNLSLTYSTTGNRTQQQDAVSGQTINYTYDQANRLTSYSVGALNKSYTYNGDGLRMTKSGPVGLLPFVWDVGAGLPLLLQDAGGSYIYGPGGELVAQIAGNDAYYYHADQLGSVRLLTVKGPAVVNSYEYDAYGTVTASSVTVGNPFGFAGEYTDSESGLVYLRARYYDPATQQFLTIDPLVGMTEQAYNYVRGNPVNFTDPLGLFAVEATGDGWLLTFSNSELIDLIYSLNTNERNETFAGGLGFALTWLAKKKSVFFTGGWISVLLMAVWQGQAGEAINAIYSRGNHLVVHVHKVSIGGLIYLIPIGVEERGGPAEWANGSHQPGPGSLSAPVPTNPGSTLTAPSTGSSGHSDRFMPGFVTSPSCGDGSGAGAFDGVSLLVAQQVGQMMWSPAR